MAPRGASVLETGREDGRAGARPMAIGDAGVVETGREGRQVGARPKEIDVGVGVVLAKETRLVPDMAKVTPRGDGAEPTPKEDHRRPCSRRMPRP